MTLRLIFRKATSDVDGKFVRFEYRTETINVDSFMMDISDLPELVGAEWVPNAINKDG